MHSTQKSFLSITKNILNSILLIIPAFIVVIIITSILFLGIFSLGKYEALLVPLSFLLSIVSIFYFNRYYILRFSFYEEYILIKYLTIPGKTIKIYYSDISSIEWHVSYTFRDHQSEYLMVLQVRNDYLSKEPYPTSLGLKYMSRESWPGIRPEYCPILDAYDIATLKKYLPQKFPFHMNNINSIDLKKIGRL